MYIKMFKQTAIRNMDINKSLNYVNYNFNSIGLILDGNLELRQLKNRFAVYLNKCLKQIKIPIFSFIKNNFWIPSGAHKNYLRSWF